MGLKSQLEEYLEAEHMRNISVQPSLQPSGLKGHRLQATSGNLHFSILDVVGYPGRLIMQGSWGGTEHTKKKSKTKKTTLSALHRDPGHQNEIALRRLTSS